jgi:hypothetical protein
MTAAPAIPLPGGRVVLGWWRDLSGMQPVRMWFAHLLLHRVEALVEVSSPPPGGSSLALYALLAQAPSPFHPAQLGALLHLDGGLLGAMLLDLAREGLIRPAGADSWELVEPNRSASPLPRQGGKQERRTFFFLEGTPPPYLALSPRAGSPTAPPDGWRFDLAVLESCVGRPAGWKKANRFPEDVARVIRFRSGPESEDWRTVPAARADQSVLVLAQTEAGAVLGFPVRPDGWALGREPVLSLPREADALALLLAEVGVEEWKQSWQAWCQQRNLPPGEAEACRLEPCGARLRVAAPPRLIERLRAARSDALKGEAWLLGGSGRVRAAAQIDLGEPG